MRAGELEKILGSRVLVLDGAMGTMVQRLGLGETDFRGDRFADHPSRLSGFNDILCLTEPEAIKGIHREYIEAGADIITTNTFNANAISMADYGMADDPGLIRELNCAGARIAREAAREYSSAHTGRSVFVAGSMGPTNKTASMSPDVTDPANRSVDYSELFSAYYDQAWGLMEGGADMLLFETVFDTLNLKAGLDAVNSVMRDKGIKLPVLVSATVSDKAGRTLSGQTVDAFAATVQDYENVVSLGLNCSFGPADIVPYLRDLSSSTNCFVSCHPNAGLPNALGEYEETPEDFVRHMQVILSERLVNIAGGCCGTTPDHIRKLKGIAETSLPREHRELGKALRVTGLELLTVKPENNFVNVGERCNVAGSRKFLRLIKDGDYTGAMSVAAAQVAAGAMVIDVNMDDPLLDSKKEMVRFLRFIASDPDISRVPVMVDSSDWDTVESALENLQGKGIVNSISLKEGEAKFMGKAQRIKELGASVIVMAFDESGQADTFERKIEVSQRAYRLLTEKCGFKPDDIIFDVNIMAVATGIEEHNRYGIDFIEAVRWIKNNLPGARTSGGVSNLSFAFRGKNALRESMHAVFLYHAIQAGLDMGIVNPSSTVTYEDIEPSLRSLIEDVVLNRRPGASEELAAYAMQEEAAGKKEESPTKRDLSIDVAERLKAAVVKGSGTYLNEDILEALNAGYTPVGIISGPLMSGMNHVGELFGAGKMFLPQVVKTARTMKSAVSILQPFMESESDRELPSSRRKAVFATVKGDVHDIGKNIVSIVLSCNGYEVIDLGVMVAPETIVDAVKAHTPDFIGLSGLITPSLSEMVNTVKALETAGIDIPVMVGGATTSELHTALKIAPEYNGLVIHVSDAAQNPVIAHRLSEEYEAFSEEIKEKQSRIRKEYQSSSNPLTDFAKAREENSRGDFSFTAPLPSAPLGETMVKDIPLGEIEPLINWKMLYAAWKLIGKDSDVKESETEKLRADANAMLEEIHSSGLFDGKGIVRFEKASSNPDGIFAGGKYFPMLRQQRYENKSLSLADFIAREDEGMDFIGIFAVTAGKGMERYAHALKEQGDEYRSLLAMTLSDRLAEAASEWMHMKVRREAWGYDPEENCGADGILRGEYKGIRPAVGYPSLPDQLLNRDLTELLAVETIGIEVTENGAMSPSSSVSGFYIANPKSRYFMIGDIGNDQLGYYASARGIDTERMAEILRL